MSMYSPRDVADALPEDEKSYLFDVDGHEGEGSDGMPDDLYSVDSMKELDAIPQMNMAYIAFVATQDIPAFTEFMFDYDPMATRAFIEQREKRDNAKGKDKDGSRSRKRAVPMGRKPCVYITKTLLKL
ncbi:hypothetical protein C0991_004012 [Blastosporella zonata]|nr:hypothetical protein C0991_004012 [Blastosporella zonata]